ncbi:MAG TPA: ATP phosphoribosyltransferase regulatory subunit [Candidatus Acidoferrum sp.]|nr:ATP phosphoribosyltransferase regulatory subunit [Candidatus Acidoferrum sp.]
MADIRFRTFRLKVYGRLCPAAVSREEREELLNLLDRLDEDGIEEFFKRHPLTAEGARAIAILREARELGERINVLDRVLPVLPHAEITQCYDRLRELGDEIGNLEAAGALN